MVINAGPNLPWTGQALRDFIGTLAGLVDEGRAEVRVDLEHHGIGSDDVTLRVRRAKRRAGDDDDKRDKCGCHRNCTVLPHECAVPCRWPECLTTDEQAALLAKLDEEGS